MIPTKFDITDEIIGAMEKADPEDYGDDTSQIKIDEEIDLSKERKQFNLPELTLFIDMTIHVDYIARTGYKNLNFVEPHNTTLYIDDTTESELEWNDDKINQAIINKN